MHDSSIVVFNFVLAGTRGIGLLMFLGQLAAFIVLLAITATVEFLMVTLGALVLRTRKSAPHRRRPDAMSPRCRLPQIPPTDDAPAVTRCR